MVSAPGVRADRRRATVHDLRRRNRAVVFEALLRAGQGTRGGLADTCALSSATLANVIGDLVEEGLVEEGGLIPSDGGRPIARLLPRAEGASVIGADVGEHGITVEMFDLRLQSIHTSRVRLRPAEFRPDRIRSTLAEALDELQTAHAEAYGRVVGMGLGLPGIVETGADGSLSVSSQSIGWAPMALDEFVPQVDFPILAENGAKTMVTAETWAGPAEASAHCVAALVGRGVGAGVVEDAQLLRGATGSAGEWGHSKVEINGRACQCGGHGCLEAYIGGTSVVERWGAAGGAVTGDDEADLQSLLDLAAAGDDAAATVLDETIQVLGIGLANLVNLLNPDVIVLGGWVGRSIGNAHLDAVRSAMLAHCLTQPGAAVDLRLSRLGDEAVSLGAALLPLQRLVNGDLPTPLPR